VVDTSDCSQFLHSELLNDQAASLENGLNVFNPYSAGSFGLSDPTIALAEPAKVPLGRDGHPKFWQDVAIGVHKCAEYDQVVDRQLL
jgi:hypothetical protein